MKALEPQRGYFLLADISGFTAYLVGVELEHSGEILKGLLEYVAAQFLESRMKHIDYLASSE